MSRVIRDILVEAPAISSATTGEEVYEYFSEDEDLLVIAVVDAGRPVGLVTRDDFFLRMADRHGRALFSKRPITFLMNKDPLIVEANTPVEEVNALIVRDRPGALMEGFIAVRRGEFIGVGTALALFAAMSRANAERTHKLSALAEQLGRARIEALAASKAKSDFLATMSHEIRTPLNGVLGIAQLLAATELDDEQQDFVRVIGDSGQILLRLLNDILDLSKIEAGKMELDLQPVALNQLAQDTASLWSGRAQQKNIGFEIDLHGTRDREFQTDPVRLKQILFNLVGNAIKFTEAGAVTVDLAVHDLSKKRSVLRCQVDDTGCGIAEAAKAKMFTAFTQADAETTRRHGGSGLGLAICKRLVDLMGGTIGFTSEEGRGSSFWFEVPMKVVKEAAASIAHTPDAELDRLQNDAAGARILVAEDNMVNQAVTSGFLKLRGLQADFVVNGQEALEACRTNRYDLVLMDMEMPVMDGLEATRRIRGLTGPNGQVKVLALTAHALSGVADRCVAAGMNGHIAKPIEKDILFAAIDQALDPDATHDRSANGLAASGS